MNNYLYKSKPPIFLYIWIILSLIIFVFMSFNWGIDITSIEIFIVFIISFYLVFNRYSSIVYIYKHYCPIKIGKYI